MDKKQRKNSSGDDEMSHKIIDHEQIRLLAADGLTAPEIATETGYCVGAVRKHAKKHGISITRGQIGRVPGFKPTPKPKTPEKTNPFASLPKSTVAAIVAPKQSAASKKLQHVMNVADEMKIIHEIADDAGIPARPCESRKPSVVEALALKIKLPWAGKVQQQAPEDLAPDLYDELIGYANFSAEDLAQVFGFTADGFRVWLKKYGYPVRDAVVAEPAAHDLTIKPRPGQTFAGRKKEMDAAPVFRAHDVEQLRAHDFADGIDTTGIVYGHSLGMDAPHAPTVDEAEEMFTPEDDKPTPYTVDPTEPPRLRDYILMLRDGLDECDAARKKIALAYMKIGEML